MEDTSPPLELLRALSRIAGLTADPHHAVQRALCAAHEFRRAMAGRYTYLNRTSGRYTRRLLNEPDDPYQAIIAEWPAGKLSPVHDHAGTHGCVVAIDGEVVERKFSARVDTDSAVHLMDGPTVTLCGPGGSHLLDDGDNQLHAMANISGRPAATLHIYLQAIHRFGVYQAIDAGLHRRVEQRLWFDEARAASTLLQPA